MPDNGSNVPHRNGFCSVANNDESQLAKEECEEPKESCTPHLAQRSRSSPS